MSTPMPAPHALPVAYFDGVHGRPQPATLTREGDDAVIRTASGEVRARWREIDWPERTRHGIRTAHLPDGGSVQGDDPVLWDAWLRTQGQSESWVVRAQQSWRGIALATVLLVVACVAGYRWGLPWAAQAVLAVVPTSVDVTLGEAALDQVEGRWLQPSKLPAAEQQRLRQRFEQAWARYQAATEPVAPPRSVRLHFRDSPLGPNALALPDGSVIVTDDLVTLLADREDAILGVLGHEVGHIQARHGMRAAVQASLLGAVTSVLLGDIGGWVAAVPATLGHLHYSRHMEREADEAGIRFLRANGVRPSALAVFFERLEAKARSSDGDAPADAEAPSLWGMTLSSHPANAERIARFKAADTAP